MSSELSRRESGRTQLQDTMKEMSMNEMIEDKVR